MSGSVASIETMTSVDGPGIRTIVFMSGCRKRCLYCHNPEMWMMGKNNYQANDLAKKLIGYKSYYGKKGGVTFSGGEPLLQTNFLIEVCKILKKENINIIIDTAGDYIGDIEKLLEYVDIVILDIKHIYKKEYQLLTKSNIQDFNKFIKILNKSNKKVILRQVIVPGIHDNKKYLIDLKKYISKINNVLEISFIPYHKLGQEKYQELNINYPLSNTLEMDIVKCNKLYQEFLNIS